MISPLQNSAEVKLLFSNPGKLYLQYNYLITFVVNKYFNQANYSNQEKEDIKQDILFKLLKNTGIFQERYNGTCLLRTYITKVVSNYCLEILRSKKALKNQVIIPNNVSIDHNFGVNKVEFEYIFNQLELIFDLYSQSKVKLLVCLKIYYKIPILLEDIEFYSEVIENKNSLILQLNDTDITLEKKYELVAPIFYYLETRNKTGDALRKWINFRILELIVMLNGNPQIYHFNKETFGYILEYFFSKEFPKN